MRTRGLSRYVLTIFVAGALMGCGGSMKPIGAPNNSAMSPFRGGPTGGNAFNGKYSGTYEWSGGRHCEFKFHGAGRASLLHESTESGHMESNLAGCEHLHGSVTFASTHHPTDTITVHISNSGVTGSDPCQDPSGGRVTRGTGRFAKATGFVTDTIMCSSGTYEDQWSGTISF